MGKQRQELEQTARFTALGCAIAHYRKRRGLSQDRLAALVGISRQHMGAVEAPHMHRGISLELLFRIAAVLEVEPYLLLKYRPGEGGA